MKRKRGLLAVYHPDKRDAYPAIYYLPISGEVARVSHLRGMWALFSQE